MASIKEQMDDVSSVTAALPEVLGPALTSLIRARGCGPPTALPSYRYAPHDVSWALYAGKVTIEEVSAAVAADNTKPEGRKKECVMSSTKEAGPTRSEGFSTIRVKDPIEKFSAAKCKARNPRTGGDLLDHKGREVYLPSEAESAVAGCYFKSVAQRGGLQVVWAEWERDVWEGVQAEADWAGDVAGQYCGEIEGTRVKTLLDDTTSGGIEIAPVVIDQNIITFPLLSGQLFPAVDVQDIPRGRRVEGASVSTPTVTWGTAEGTAITPFTTDGLVAGLDTTIYPVTCAVEIGRDFMADSIVNIGETLTRLIGERLAAELDYVLAVGNGTSQPTGLFTASGLTDIGAPAAGAGGAWATTDVENLYFGVGLQYRTGPGVAFVSNDTTYKRVRQIAYATAAGWTFNTRAMNMDIGSYRIFDLPWRIQNDIPNARALCGDLRRYRLYRRVGLASEITTEGRTLRLSNLALLTVRARFGGRVMDASAFAKGTQYQA